MYTPVNPSFTTEKWGLRGSKLYKYVSVMAQSDLRIRWPLMSVYDLMLHFIQFYFYQGNRYTFKAGNCQIYFASLLEIKRSTQKGKNSPVIEDPFSEGG